MVESKQLDLPYETHDHDFQNAETRTVVFADKAGVLIRQDVKYFYCTGNPESCFSDPDDSNVNFIDLPHEDMKRLVEWYQSEVNDEE